MISVGHHVNVKAKVMVRPKGIKTECSWYCRHNAYPKLHVRKISLMLVKKIKYCKYYHFKSQLVPSVLYQHYKRAFEQKSYSICIE